MNKLINHNELKELFNQPSETEENLDMPATNMVPNAINDNFFLAQHKFNLVNTTPKKQGAVK